MNTPTHVILGLAVLPKQSDWTGVGAIAAGAVLPDALMFGFYGFQKFMGRPEREIWTERYYDPEWQLAFDGFNSLPLYLVLLLVGWWAGWNWLMLLSASAALHCVCDLPLHHDDGHRHFLPLSHWRYASPVSYWDRNYYGHVVAPIEAVVALLACVYLVWPDKPAPTRVSAGFLTPLFVLQLGVMIALTKDLWHSTCHQLADEAAATASDGATSSGSTPALEKLTE